jgi:hypothetical protein
MGIFLKKFILNANRHPKRNLHTIKSLKKLAILCYCYLFLSHLNCSLRSFYNKFSNFKILCFDNLLNRQVNYDSILHHKTKDWWKICSMLRCMSEITNLINVSYFLLMCL